MGLNRLIRGGATFVRMRRPVHSVGSMNFAGSVVLQRPKVIGSGSLTGFMNSGFGVGCRVFVVVSVDDEDPHINVGTGIQVLEVLEV